MTLDQQEITDKTEDPFHIPPHDEVSAESPTIAEREMEISRKKDRQIAGLLRETSRMSDVIDEHERTLESRDAMLAVLKRDLAAAKTELQRQIDVHENWLSLSEKADKAQKEHIEALERDLAKKGSELAEVGAAFAEMMQEHKPAKRKIETITIYDFSDVGLADRINQGWRVVFEDYMLLPATITDELGDTRDARHVVRREREVQESATPPQEEARQGERLPTLEEAADMPLESDDEMPEEDETPESTHEIMFHVGGSKPILTPVIGRTYEAIDPADMDLRKPLAENVYRYGAQAVGQAQDLRIAAGMQEVQLRWTQQTQRLLGGIAISPAVTPTPASLAAR